MSIDPPMWDSHPFFIIDPPPGAFMLSDKNMPTGPPIVYEKIQDMPKEPSEEIEDMLVEYHDGISESCFETTYKEMFKRSLDYNSLGVKNIEELLVKMCDAGKVLVDKDPNTNERHVKLACLHEGSSFFEIHDRPTESSDLYQEIQYLISGYGHGVSMYWLEERYKDEFGKLPDYRSVGLNDLKELIGNMKDKGRVLVFEDPESKATYVKCAWLVDIQRKHLKRKVLKVLGMHGGEIPLSGFDCAFEDWFKLKLEYHQYGLKDIYHLCEVLNLGLEEADSPEADSPPGEMVIKARKNIYYNLRSKRNG